MERLTKKGNKIFNYGEFNNKYTVDKRHISCVLINENYEKKDCCYMGNAIDKLAEFEDFMESLGSEELEQLEHLIGYPRFVDGYDEQGKEINRIEFITYKESFNEVFDKNKKLKQENQALKGRWQKLKEHIITLINESKDKFDSRGISLMLLIDKMQELEKEKNERH